MGLFSRNDDNARPKPQKVVDLNAAVSSLVLSVLQARAALDRQTVELARLYRQDELLSGFDVPSFAIDEITLRLPYATSEVLTPKVQANASVEDVPHMLVQVDADLLAHLPPHAVGQIELKLSQQQLLMPPSNGTPNGGA